MDDYILMGPKWAYFLTVGVLVTFGYVIGWFVHTQVF